MTEATNNQKPDIFQAFDKFVDREYYKITPGFFGSYEVLLRVDRQKEWKEWNIMCESLPDKLLINGEEYRLEKL